MVDIDGFSVVSCNVIMKSGNLSGVIVGEIDFRAGNILISDLLLGDLPVQRGANAFVVITEVMVCGKVHKRRGEDKKEQQELIGAFVNEPSFFSD